MKYIIFFIGLLIGSTSAIAQKIDLQEKLKGKQNLNEIMTIVDQHYEDIDGGLYTLGNDPKYKHWVRWAHYMSTRTDENGNLVDKTKLILEAQKVRAGMADTKSSTGDWTFIGPQTITDGNQTNSAIGIGRVDRIAFDPVDSDVLYIGTPAGGMFLSRDGGQTWSARSDNLPSTGVSGIVASFEQPGKVFILTGDGDSNIGGFVERFGYMRSSAGIFRSFNYGASWNKMGDLPITGDYVGYQLIQDPNNANILLAATSEGTYRSKDGGWNWTLSFTGRTYELKFKPGSSSIIYATQSGRFLKSIDGGISFVEIPTNPRLPNGRVALAVTEFDNNLVYLLSGGGSNGATYGGIYRSNDEGNTWNQQSNTPNVVDSACAGDGSGNRTQSTYDLAIGVSHQTNGRLVTGAIRAWRSTNGGSTMVNAHPSCSSSNSTGTVHADIHDIEYHPLTNAVFVCSDGGLHKSTSHGQRWTSLSDNIAASQIYHLTGNTENTTRMMIGLQDNGTKVKELQNTNNWIHRTGADGYDQVYRNGSFTNGYLTINQDVFSFSNHAINLDSITPLAGSNKEWFGRVATANNNGNVVLVGYTDIFRSSNSGTSWTNVGVTGNWDIESCPSNSNRFYAVGGSSAMSTIGRIFSRSDDQGQTWTQLISTGVPTTLKTTDIGVRPNNSNNVWQVYGGFSDGQKVYYSGNTGSSWTNRTGNLPNVPVNCIQVDSGNNVYIGTDIGVFYLESGSANWVPFDHGLPRVPVSDMVLYESDNLLRISTFGRGVWESDTYTNCPQNLVINSNLYGNDYFEASQSIITESTLSGGLQTSVIMKAGSRVTMNPGFRASPNNFYRAYISPCGVADIEEE